MIEWEGELICKVATNYSAYNRDQFFSGARLKGGPKNAKLRTKFTARFRIILAKTAFLRNARH